MVLWEGQAHACECAQTPIACMSGATSACTNGAFMHWPATHMAQGPIGHGPVVGHRLGTPALECIKFIEWSKDVYMSVV